MGCATSHPLLPFNPCCLCSLGLNLCCSCVNSHNLKSLDLDGVTQFMEKLEQKKERKDVRIVVMVGAGISVSAGVPDFRSMTTGIYQNKMDKYSLPTPQHMFDIDYFISDQGPFYDFVKTELYPKSSTLPTVFHHFMNLLQEKKMLSRIYTQNIDMLERLAGIPQEIICEVHGTLSTSSCANCKKQCDGFTTMRRIRKGEKPTCEKCGGPQKPDIVFFGEKMPRKVQEQMKLDMPDLKKCDLLIVAGTSLAVQPFASFIDAVPRSTPRIFINRDSDGSGRNGEYDDPGGQHLWGKCGNYRDVLLRGDCDKVVTNICRDLGWLAELQSKIKTFADLHKKKGSTNVEEKLFPTQMGERRGSKTAWGAIGSTSSKERLDARRSNASEKVRRKSSGKLKKSESERSMNRNGGSISPSHRRKLSKSNSNSSLTSVGSAAVHP
ncbi:hypothetical protein TrST_g11389 [Triparma strigata]|uniref:Deacetylase sirtuin-type domain-containing protein n=1 Tax=Triparma strigata TaxID=1606541 RepID=A0A9W7EFC9_9STRA|nr:hypothetical protein TrST_g11389 [Triparma strigata]